MNRRIYSLNLIAFLKQKRFEEIEKGKDEFSGKIYYCFEESEDVASAIEDYKNDEKLQDFLRNFKDVKKFVRRQQ